MSETSAHLLNDVFLAAVDRWPERTALVCQGESWTYQELYNNALNYAQAIHEKIGESESGCVAIYGTKSLQTAAAILGTLLAGFTYMPLDITLPANRLASTLDIAKPNLLFVTTLNPYLKMQLELMQPQALITLAMQQVLTQAKKVNRVIPRFNAERIAYLLFTSGSTGLPKGVCISHRAVMAALTMLLEHVPFHQDDKIASQSAFCYDLSVFDLFAAFKVGATVHLLPPEIMKVPKVFVEYVKQHKLTSLYMVSSALEYILKYANDNESRLPFKRILLTGDPISPTLIALMNRHIEPHCTILNLYSSVEMPYAYTQPVSLTDHTQDLKYFPWKGSMIDASIEEGGVLTIQGPILFSGYLNANTNLQTLQENPCKIYRTGDWVILNDDGIQLFGRVDRQVKVMGNRIELDDIEINLESLTQVQEAAVIFDKDKQQLSAYVVLKNEFQDQPNMAATLRQLCSKSLAAIMVPQHIYFLLSMPRTTSGKKDRKSLTIEMSINNKVEHAG